jgi:hypothetical protein
MFPSFRPAAMMKLLLWLLPFLFHATCHAFAIPRTDSVSQWRNAKVARLTSDEFSSSNPSLYNNSGHEKDEWLRQLQSTEIQEVRKELVGKYVELGKTQAEAEIEVDRFLADPDQSGQYLQMRRLAKSQELVGPEFFFQLAGSFALGWLAMDFAHRGVEVSYLLTRRPSTDVAHFDTLMECLCRVLGVYCFRDPLLTRFIHFRVGNRS